MSAEERDRDTLVEDLTRARNALRETIALVETGWERASGARPDDPEPWTPRAAAEHAISADLGFTAMIARAVELPAVPRTTPDCPTPAAALDAIAAAEDEASRILDAVTDDALAIEVEFAGHVGTLMHFAANHLREHARQVARLR